MREREAFFAQPFIKRLPCLYITLTSNRLYNIAFDVAVAGSGISPYLKQQGHKFALRVFVPLLSPSKRCQYHSPFKWINVLFISCTLPAGHCFPAPEFRWHTCTKPMIPSHILCWGLQQDVFPFRQTIIIKRLSTNFSARPWSGLHPLFPHWRTTQITL